MRYLIPRVLLVATMATVPLLFACSNQQAEPRASREGVQEPVHQARTSQEVAALARAEFDVAGMDCGGCVIGTRAALRKLDGVTEADATYDDATGEGTAWAVYDPAKVTPERLMATILELGYTPTMKEG